MAVPITIGMVDLPAGRRAIGIIMFFVYILKSEIRNYIYVGLTNNVERRFDEHNNGKEKTTKPYKPFVLIHFEKFNTRAEARDREKKLKSGIGKEWIKTNLLE